ncbi:hypothetical protein V6N13_028126 [Hibiscus sabdariffa]
MLCGRSFTVFTDNTNDKIDSDAMCIRHWNLPFAGLLEREESERWDNNFSSTSAEVVEAKKKPENSPKHNVKLR